MDCSEEYPEASSQGNVTRPEVFVHLVGRGIHVTSQVTAADVSEPVQSKTPDVDRHRFTAVLLFNRHRFHGRVLNRFTDRSFLGVFHNVLLPLQMDAGPMLENSSNIQHNAVHRTGFVDSDRFRSPSWTGTIITVLDVDFASEVISAAQLCIDSTLLAEEAHGTMDSLTITKHVRQTFDTL